MKLRNKKTGMIGEVGYLATSDGKIIVNNINDQDEWYEYGSLAELNEEWEDYEEPKEFYHITVDGYVVKDNYTITKDFADDLERIGNYFETEEEAEKAVEKLKAWKRLKGKGFKFQIWWGKPKDIWFRLDTEIDEDIAKDLDLLFGGEE
jgi:hypothetical protein